MKGLIREGSLNPAIIRITLSNEGSDAHLPDEYGDRIIVERTLLLNSSSKYKLINKKTGVVVSTSKTSLERMMSDFSILVDNPVCVLTQEESKKFIGGKPHEQYEFFLKATGLLQLSVHLHEQIDDLLVIGNELVKSESVVIKKKEEATHWGAILSKFQEFEGLEDAITEARVKAVRCDLQADSVAVDDGGKALKQVIAIHDYPSPLILLPPSLTLNPSPPLSLTLNPSPPILHPSFSNS
jgi:chromosome segregation ATPase